MSYLIKDGSGATQTVEADTVGGMIQPVSSPVDVNGNHLATAPGVANTNSALAMQGVTGGVPVPVTATQLPTNAAQGSTTASQTGILIQGAVTTAAPSYTTAQTSPLSLTTAGLLRVDASGTTSPVNFSQYGGTGVINGGTAGLLGVGGGVASGGTNANNPVKIGGVFNTTQPTVTSGQIVDIQTTARGAQIVAIGVDGFAITTSQQPSGDGQTSVGSFAAGNQLYNGASWDRQRAAAGTTGIAAVNTESTKATYQVSASLAVTASGDVVVIQGSGTKTIRILRVEVGGVLTTAAVTTATLVKRSTAPTGGTTGSLDTNTPTSMDSSDAATTATVTAYTAPPTAGTNAGFVRRSSFAIPTAAAATMSPFVAEFTRGNDKAPVLRGTSQWFAVNLSTASWTGAVINVSVTYTEE